MSVVLSHSELVMASEQSDPPDSHVVTPTSIRSQVVPPSLD